MREFQMTQSWERVDLGHQTVRQKMDFKAAMCSVTTLNPSFSAVFYWKLRGFKRNNFLSPSPSHRRRLHEQCRYDKFLNAGMLKLTATLPSCHRRKEPDISRRNKRWRKKSDGKTDKHKPQKMPSSDPPTFITILRILTIIKDNASVVI